jgi:transglutaminase-like putative cysteine protease
MTEKLSCSDHQQEAVIDRYDELLRPTDYTPTSKRITAVGKRIAKEHEPAEAVIAAATWVRSELDYVKGSTGVHTSGSDALREGKGVCQDFVHLSLMVLRGMGIPARYVSGYHHPDADAVIGETVDGQSHAWIQAWTGNWWDHDPTIDSEINEQYVTVGVGRDYSDVSPLKGIYHGQGATDLDVVVEITRLA